MPHVAAISELHPLQGNEVESVSSRTASIRVVGWMIAGMVLVTVGGIWDFAWHMSIGRDTMWVPPHIMIQTGGILAGLAGAYAILMAMTSAAARETGIRVLGLHGPSGAFIVLWGSIAMLTSEPWDNWWHNAYGLDVKMISPPHTLLFIGSFALKFGTMALIASLLTRAVGDQLDQLRGSLLFVGALAVTQLSIVVAAPTATQNLHGAISYLVLALFIPPAMLATGWGSGHKWGCSIAGLIYTFLMLASEWLIPLFPAQPKLGPVFHNVTHLVPMRFPLLLIVPAVVADLLLQKFASWSSWRKSVIVGPAMLLGLLFVQWPFATFLLSPIARNWVFGSAYFSYQDPAGILYDPYQFNVVQKTATAFVVTMVMAMVASMLSTRLGLAWGRWLRRICR